MASADIQTGNDQGLYSLTEQLDSVIQSQLSGPASRMLPPASARSCNAMRHCSHVKLLSPIGILMRYIFMLKPLQGLTFPCCRAQPIDLCSSPCSWPTDQPVTLHPQRPASDHWVYWWLQRCWQQVSGHATGWQVTLQILLSLLAV